MQSNLIVGLISGLTVSFIVMFLGKIWRDIIEPWFEERVYKDMHIEGKWFSLYVSDIDLRTETVNLKRKGHSVTGTLMCNSGGDDGEEYTLTGSFRNLLLPLTYETSDKKKTDRGTITLMSSHNGERLVGKVAMYHTKLDEVSTAPVLWFRKKDDINEQIKYIKEHRETLQKIRKKEESVKEEMSDFFKEFMKEYKERKRKKKEEENKVIEGEAKKIEHDG